MIDRIFSAALTFCLLVAGTLAIGSALFGQDTRTARAPTPVIELPTVTVIGQRTAMSVDASASKVAANIQDVGDCAITKTMAPESAVQPSALAHI
jgi:hypothetical protein